MKNPIYDINNFPFRVETDFINPHNGKLRSYSIWMSKNPFGHKIYAISVYSVGPTLYTRLYNTNWKSYRQRHNDYNIGVLCI